MKFFERDPWYRKLVQRSIQLLLPRRKTSSLRSRLLAITGIGTLLVSGFTFAVGGVGATIAWPNAPAGEATGGFMMTYFRNMFGDLSSTGTGKTCFSTGVLIGFSNDGTPNCKGINEIIALASGTTTVVPGGSTPTPMTSSTTTLGPIVPVYESKIISAAHNGYAFVKEDGNVIMRSGLGNSDTYGQPGVQNIALLAMGKTGGIGCGITTTWYNAPYSTNTSGCWNGSGPTQSTQVVQIAPFTQNSNYVSCYLEKDSGRVGGSCVSTIPSEFTGTGRAIQVGANNTTACALRENHTLNCWGTNSTGYSFPNSLTNVAQISVGVDNSCAVLMNGGLMCWSNTNTQIATPSAFGNNVAQVTVGQVHACITRTDATVACWLLDGSSTVPSGYPSSLVAVPAGLSNIVDLSAGYNETCAVNDQRKIACWGSKSTTDSGFIPNNYQWSPPPTLSFSASNTAIVSGNTTTLSWNTTNVSSCTKSGDWTGTLTGNQNSQSLTTSALTSNKSYTLTCVNTSGVSVVRTVNISVTSPTTPSIIMPSPSPSTVNAGSSVTLSWNATPATSCTTTGPSGDTSTWAASGLSGSGSRIFTPTVSGNYTITCYNGSVNSSQSVNITVTAVSVPPITTGTVTSNIISSISAGYNYTCALDNTNTVSCWDDDSLASNDLATPSDLGSVQKVYGGMYHNCIIKSDGGVRCWGTAYAQTNFGMLDVPSEATNVVQLSLGAFHTCALKSIGDVVCWGNNSHGQSTVPTTIHQNVKQILTTFYGSCALKIDDTIECWGSDASLLNAKFASLPGSNIAQISFNQETGYNHYVCKLTTSGYVSCGWLYSLSEGRYPEYDWGMTSVPSDLSDVRKIVTGKYSVCALKNDSSVVCWGLPAYVNTINKNNILDIAMGGSSETYTLSNAHIISARPNMMSHIPSNLK